MKKITTVLALLFITFGFEFGLFNDYPKFSIWPDGYYSTYNMFQNDFEGVIIAAMDRDAMLVGNRDAQIIMFGVRAFS